MKTLFSPLRWLDRLPVRRQLFVAFGSVLLLATALGLAALWSLHAVNDRAALLSHKWLKGVGSFAEARSHLLELRELEVKHSRTADASYHAEYEDKMKQTAASLDGVVTAAREHVSAEGEQALVDALVKHWSEYRKAQENVVKLGRSQKQQDAADIADGASGMAFEEVLGALAKLVQFNYDGGSAAAGEAQAVYERSRLGVTGGLLLALLIGGGLSITITRGLMRQLGGEPRRAAEVARAVAEGRLDSQVVTRAGDEASILASLRAMQARLSTTVNDVRLGAEQVACASEEIARGNDDLSGRTEHQARELQETASNMQQLSAAVRVNAEHAQQARQLAEQASGVAVEGGTVVGRVVQTMRGIDESSRRIAEIISVIDGIAFQTNILALNAAVEAARAGEQGRGFAVVAAEVRSLAQRSAAAAREIKNLISASVERVDEGSALVAQAGETMQKVVASIEGVTRIVADISAASAEQRDGVTGLESTVRRIDEMTQQNAALVEQGAAAAATLKDQSRQLVSAVAVFRT